MSSAYQDLFGATSPFPTDSGVASIFKLETLEKNGIGNISNMPCSIKILLEAVLRHCNNYDVTEEAVHHLANWQPAQQSAAEVPFKPARVLLQDFTGVPAVVDLAAMRSAMARLGGDPKKIEPLIPCDLVIDHSVQTDKYGTSDALKVNMEIEFQRNRERYEFLKWGQQAFAKLGVIPPGVGIIHQVNLEYLARGVFEEEGIVYPDSLVGTDSHTVMINGLGIVGWGVGGIEAEAVMLGQPLFMLAPPVIGFKLEGELPEGTTATDLTLTVVQMLRKKGVVGTFVEFYGEGVTKMSLPDRATVANMAPEYGATMGFFPMDEESLNYLRRTGRPEKLVRLVERYMKEQGLFRTPETPDPHFSDTLVLDMSTVEPSLAGPKRPHDRLHLGDMKKAFYQSLKAPMKERGFELSEAQLKNSATVTLNNHAHAVTHGFIAIASITSCTNTSNPAVMLGAGLLAKKAVEKGLRVPNYVKTSLAPGSRVVTEYLNKAGLTPYLDQLGFHTVGYGCASCIGNSGPLAEAVAEAIEKKNIIAASVLSGNRNFEGRVNPLAKANYLASPPLVVAFALAGRVDIDLTTEPIGFGKDGENVYLKDIWPSQTELMAIFTKASNPEMFAKIYRDVNALSPMWKDVRTTTGDIYEWDPDSTYVQEPPFFVDLHVEPEKVGPIHNARVLALLGDSVTTDHISPAGSIPKDSPAAKYLIDNGVARVDFNSFGARRGNDRVMVRGTFGNIRLKNLLAPGTEGGVTLHVPDGEQMWIYDAAMQYKEENVPLVVLAGKEYGSGSSRDWAAKGTLLLGVKAVIAESYERIHRSNLVGMGVLPLQFVAGESVESLGLTGHEEFSIDIPEHLKPQQDVVVTATLKEKAKTFQVQLRLDTAVEIDYYRHGGILPAVLRKMLNP
ncbi:aconitate hydratase AcnA [candidate division KSB1 bacterium]|nr:aconitate hydratase AcnA [candidate division KSB1 bacterium]RQW01841.1 MAG: aconitate hydratase AcnA [candidate division KSB1 bacterium]